MESRSSGVCECLNLKFPVFQQKHRVIIDMPVKYLIIIVASFMLFGCRENQKSATSNSKQETMETTNKWMRKSPYSVKVTMDRLQEILKEYPEVYKYDRIDQQEVAKVSGENIRPVEVAFFQNSTLVGKLLAANIEVAQVLPIKATVWEDENGQVWIHTIDMDKLNEEYKLNGAEGAIQSIFKLLPVWLDRTVEKK